MQKLMKNWIFTLVIFLLLAVFALVMILDGFEVGQLYLWNQYKHMISAVTLALYVIFVLSPLVAHYRGKMRGFLFFEIAFLTVAVVGQACSEFFSIPWVSTMQVCSLLGLALWLRGTVKIVHAYLLNGSEAEKKIPLWQLCGYILLCSLGVWQMVRPTIPNAYFVFCIGGAALIISTIFGYATVQNRKELGPLFKKKVKADAAGGEPVAEEPASLPTAADEPAAEPKAEE